MDPLPEESVAEMIRQELAAHTRKIAGGVSGLAGEPQLREALADRPEVPHDAIEIRVIWDNGWNRYNCKLTVGEVDTGYQFVPLHESREDFDFALRDMVERSIDWLRAMKGVNIVWGGDAPVTDEIPEAEDVPSRTCAFCGKARKVAKTYSFFTGRILGRFDHQSRQTLTGTETAWQERYGELRRHDYPVCSWCFYRRSAVFLALAPYLWLWYVSLAPMFGDWDRSYPHAIVPVGASILVLAVCQLSESKGKAIGFFLAMQLPLLFVANPPVALYSLEPGSDLRLFRMLIQLLLGLVMVGAAVSYGPPRFHLRGRAVEERDRDDPEAEYRILSEAEFEAL